MQCRARLEAVRNQVTRFGKLRRMNHGMMLSLSNLLTRSRRITPAFYRAMSLAREIPVFSDVASYRVWRQSAFRREESVGLVPTMGALHVGHLDLVRKSLAANDHTIVSIFVNPAQFAPHEDFSSYPRTLPSDLAALATLVSAESESESLQVLVPQTADMYPTGISQDTAQQRGAFVALDGLTGTMEGAARPHFFRGVATVVCKLFNAVQPTRAYFGQKDIQQALLLRRMAQDLLMTLPSAENVRIVRTTRAEDGLALSSRNAYLSEKERAHATVLYRALTAGANAARPLEAAQGVVQEAVDRAKQDGVDMRPEYISVNDPETFEEISDDKFERLADKKSVMVISGAVWVGKTRLIDNLILGDVTSIVN
ncbi:pantothenate synthetase [Auriculariales sp. MPI-PUGE-AT-0066]|nr:pantothenate synthetase [Auriculariales sp. MPI-PUGE-AT-0066]